MVVVLGRSVLGSVWNSNKKEPLNINFGALVAFTSIRAHNPFWSPIRDFIWNSARNSLF